MIRGSSIYIQTDTYRLLKIISKVRGKEEPVDQVADELLQKAIVQACPKLGDYLEKQKQLEQQMIEELSKYIHDTQIH